MLIVVKEKYEAQQEKSKVKEDQQPSDPYTVIPPKCSICYDADEQAFDQFIELECSVEHKFHKSCLRNWVLERKANIQAGNCPFCRGLISNYDLAKLFNCIICNDDPDKSNDQFIALQCSPNHRFHKNCLRQLILRRRQLDIGITCPICIQIISNKDLKKILKCRCCCFAGF